MRAGFLRWCQNSLRQISPKMKKQQHMIKKNTILVVDLFCLKIPDNKNDPDLNRVKLQGL